MKKKRLRLLVCALAIGLTAGLANADIESGLVGHWAFDDGFGDVAVDSTGNSNGVLFGDPQWVPGKVGDWALEFDAAGVVKDHVIAAHVEAHDDFGVELTVAGWLKPDWEDTDLTKAAGIIAMRNQLDGGGYGFRVNRAGTAEGPLDFLYGRINAGGKHLPDITTTVPMSDGDWHHFALVADGTTLKMYVDGVLDFDEPFYSPGPISTGPGEIRIAKSIYSRPEIGNDDILMYRGLLDDMRFYNRALSGDDVMELVALGDSDYNIPPIVEAGEYQSFLWPGSSLSVQLDATVSDDGKPADPCEVTLTWSQISGPGVVTFDPCSTVEDPIVTFTTAGMYELRLRGYDGEKDACDVVAIHIRANDDPIAHWDFEDGIGDTVDDESANNNVGDLAGNSEPNWVSGWVGDWAMEFYADDPAVISYVDITSDISAADPNLETLRYDITLAAWFKIGDLDVTNSPVIVANGDLGWRLYANHDDGGTIVFTPGDGVAHWQNRTTSVKLLDDGYWHHVVGMYDYANSKSYLYVDGVFEAESSDHVGMMAEADDKPVTIGARATSATEAARGWNGMIDDVQVYSYCISEAKIAELAAMGDLVPQVDAGPDQTVSMLDGPIQLAGTATDDGEPNPSLAIEWSKVSGIGTVTFDPCDAAVATATFSEADTYVLRLTVDDGNAVQSDTVTIYVSNPTCADVIADGLLIDGDISGPEGSPDCRVDLYDFAVFAGEWLSCNNPSDIDCESPF